MTEQSEELYEAAKEAGELFTHILDDDAENWDGGNLTIPQKLLLATTLHDLKRAISRYERTRLGMLTEVPVR